jgi:ABC-2 type transport system ATP-binding protein
MPTYAAEFADVTRTYHSWLRPRHTVQALRGVSFRVEAGEVFALLGPNRAGKSTLLKILLGLCRPTGGTVLRLGRPLSDRSTLARVGYMHENQAFPRYLTAAALLAFYGTLAWVPEARLRTRVPALLERVGLADRADEPIRRFSKGMVQRLALAQALLNEPELLVLDEPQEGLDLTARVLLREVVAEQRRAGRTVLVVSHALGEMAQLCDRLAVLVEGRLAHLGPVAELLHDPQTKGTRSLETALEPLYRT